MKYFLCLMMALTLLSCSSDDDICIGGEATPRLKMKFKDRNNKLVQLPQLYIDVDYGSGSKNIISKTLVDSVVIPLKIDGTGATDFVVKTSASGKSSTVHLKYTEESSYVSPACGIKKIYKNVTSALSGTEPVKSVELNQTEIINENKTHLYLIF